MRGPAGWPHATTPTTNQGYTTMQRRYPYPCPCPTCRAGRAQGQQAPACKHMLRLWAGMCATFAGVPTTRLPAGVAQGVRSTHRLPTPPATPAWHATGTGA